MVSGPFQPTLGPLGPSRPWYPAAWTPLKLPNLVQWFDADQAGGVDGQPLATLPDLSPNGKNGVQETESKQPLWIADALGGHAAIRADGVDDFYTLPALSVSSGTSRTIVVCFNSPVSVNNQRYLFDAATGRLAVFLSNDATHSVGYLDGASARYGTAHVAGWQVLSITLLPNVQGIIRRNGAVLGMPSFGPRSIGGACTLFSHNAGATLFTDCDLGGWIIYNSISKEVDRVSAETYYKRKYGIT